MEVKSDLTIQTIVTKQLSKRFNREWIFKNIDFTFRAGKIYAVVGPNGSGKSTLLQCLSGMMPPTSGTIYYETVSGTINAEQVYNHISIAAPYMDLIEEFTLAEHFKFHFKLKPPRKGFDVDKAIENARFNNAREKQVGFFSSGMKQRLKLALAFYSNTSILLLDEPITNLDSESISWYFRELEQFSAEAVVIIASNNPAEFPSDAVILNLGDYKG